MQCAPGAQAPSAGRPLCALPPQLRHGPAVGLWCTTVLPDGRWQRRLPCTRTPPAAAAASTAAAPPPLSLAADLPFGNPLFAAPGLSPSPAQNPVFSPATLGTAPQSAVGMRRLAVLPRSQLQAAAAAAPASPGSSDDAMADGDGFMEEDAGGQPPADSLAVVSPGAAGAAGGRERPEEEEFASILGAGEWTGQQAHAL